MKSVFGLFTVRGDRTDQGTKPNGGHVMDTMKKWTNLAMVVATMLMLGSAVTQAGPFDITTLPGYGVATSMQFNFSPGGWAGWSVPAGKVVLGAAIISVGDDITDFPVFRPASPGEAFPHYTYGADEYGWVLQAHSGQSNPGVQIEVYYADPLVGYTITQSMLFNYNGAGGYAGWSAPSGHVVSGGGYHFQDSDSYATVSTLAVEDSVWPHYTYGPAEQGWVVAGPDDNTPPNPGYVYVISFELAPVANENKTWGDLKALYTR